MTAFTNKFAKIMAQANVVVKPTEKRFVEFCQETVQNGKYSMKAIFALAWREVKKAKRSFSSALSYAWDIAKSQMQSSKRNKNLDLRSMGFTRLD